VPVEAAAVRPSEQRPVGALTNRSVDRSSCAWGQRDEGGLVALAHDADHAVSVGERQVAEVGAARLGHAQGVECE
jgi:hypothetical protein